MASKPDPTPGIGFDNETYIKEQIASILERVDRFHEKLYLEFGGKIMYDYHASRVLPGFDPNVKMRLLQELRDKTDIILCIHAGDIERKKMRADFGISYDSDALKTIDDFREWGIDITAVVITRYQNQLRSRNLLLQPGHSLLHNFKPLLWPEIHPCPENQFLALRKIQLLSGLLLGEGLKQVKINTAGNNFSLV